MKYEFDYLTSVCTGIFIGSLLIFLGRILSYPITGLVLGIIFSAFVASFLYNPSNKKHPTHRALRGSTASIILCFIFGIFFTSYYIPRFSSILTTTDVSASVSVLVILALVFFGGLIIGSISGSIGSTIRDLVSVATSRRENKE